METPTESLQYEVGDLIQARYRVQKHLGGGGFGSVYLVVDIEDELLAVPRALKLVDISKKGESEAEELRVRFIREGKLACRLPNHTNLVKVHKAGYVDQNTRWLYMIQDYVNGSDLEGKTFPLGRALELFAGALDGLGVLHQAGIVHRDLKPENLMICEEHNVLKIIDLGIAKDTQTNQHSGLTQKGVFIGTVRYGAPECFRSGVGVKVNAPSSDVYQMGLILIEMLTGARAVGPHTHNLEYANAHIKGELNVPKALAESPVGEVIRKATHLEQSERYADGAAFAQALRDVRRRLSVDEEELTFDQPEPEADAAAEAADAPEASAETDTVAAPKQEASSGVNPKIAVAIGLALVLALLVGVALYDALTAAA